MAEMKESIPKASMFPHEFASKQLKPLLPALMEQGHDMFFCFKEMLNVYQKVQICFECDNIQNCNAGDKEPLSNNLHIAQSNILGIHTLMPAGGEHSAELSSLQSSPVVPQYCQLTKSKQLYNRLHAWEILETRIQEQECLHKTPQVWKIHGRSKAKVSSIILIMSRSCCSNPDSERHSCVIATTDIASAFS